MKKTEPERFRMGIIGMGPVGSTLAAHFIEAGAFVVPCDIDPKRIDHIKKTGIQLKHAINKSIPVEEACYSVQELAMYDLDLVVIAVKTTALNLVVKQLSEIASDKMYVMCAQNGIDNEQIAAKYFGEKKTLRMVINYAGNMSDRNTVHVSFFNPPNYVAALLPQGDHVAEKIRALLNSVDLKTETPEDIQDYVWEKAILNASLSGLCAITKRTMQDVMSFSQTQEMVESIIEESIIVAESEGIDLGKKFKRFCIRYLKNAGHHRPSMLVDLENGQRTEIDFLNGKIVEYGRKHYLPTPINQAVTALVHLLEKGSES